MNLLLMGYYGSRNLGDEIMFQCLQEWLKAQRIDVTVLCENAAETSDRFGIPAIENVPLLFEWAWRDVWFRGKAFRLLKGFRQTDGLIVGGGDLIRDDRGWRIFMYSVEKLLLAFLLRKPVFLLNVGIGRPSTKYGRRLLFWLLRRCQQIVVRDERSMDICRQAHARAILAPDIAVHLKDWLGNWPGPHTDGHGSYMLVCLRATSNAFGLYRLDEPDLQNLAVALDEVAARNGLKVIFLPFQSSSLEREDDNDVHRDLARRMKPESVECIKEWTSDLKAVLGYIGGASCILAMRLHAAVLAASCNRPCVVMPYDHKVLEAARMFNIADSITPACLGDPATIVGALERAIKKRSYRQASRSPSAQYSWDSLRLSSELPY